MSEHTTAKDALRWEFVRKNWTNVSFQWNKNGSLRSINLKIGNHGMGTSAEMLEREVDAAIAKAEGKPVREA